jgi:hypothetical protein
VIESELKAVNPDMKPIFFDALNRDGSISEQTISTESLGRAFGPLQKQVHILHFVSHRAKVKTVISGVHTSKY